MDTESLFASFELPFEAVRCAILAVLLVWLVKQGRTRAVLARSGWSYLVWGFACILASSLTDFAEAVWEQSGSDLSDSVEEIQAFTRGILVIAGFALAARGLISFVPTIWKLDAEIVERRRAEASLRIAMEQAHQAAYHDNLTDLPNRRLYAERLDEATTRAGSKGEHVGLVVLDLNNFKIFNDTMGHEGGDTLLREVARRLRSSALPGSTVARLGGDEFAIILPELASSDALMDITRQTLSGLEGDAMIDGFQTGISYCAGAALWPRDGETAGELLKSADLALYAAKSDVPGTVCSFTPAMRSDFESRARMISDARNALRDGRVVPFYQPKICLQSGNLTGFEALLRWRDENGVLQAPGAIAAAFDDVKISISITDYMLDRVVSDCVRWREQDIAPGRIALNASAADFRRGDLADRILERLLRARLPASVLELEVTESVFIGQSADQVRTILETLRAAGVTIALDDFGTGYASLTHLQQFPVDVLKIDRSFVSRINGSGLSGEPVIDAVLQMARSLTIATVAEGIETKEQADYLRARGCDIGQGFLFSRAVPHSDASALCSDQKGSLLAWYIQKCA